MTRFWLMLAALLLIGANAYAQTGRSGMAAGPTSLLEDNIPGDNRIPASSYRGEFSVPAENRYLPFSADLPSCEDHETTWWIKNRFAHTEGTFWNSSVQIVNIDEIREIGYRSNGISYIPRRFCIGRAELSDKKFHTVIYQIQERNGIAGFSNGFEFCVVGYDNESAYSPSCSVLRPLIDRYAHDKLTYPPKVN